MYVILRVVYLQELFWLQPNSHCCFLFVTTEVLQKCFGGARWKVGTVICHAPLSFLTGNTGNSCKKWGFLSSKCAVGERRLFVGFPFSVSLSEMPLPGCRSPGPGEQGMSRGPGAQLLAESEGIAGEATSALTGCVCYPWKSERQGRRTAVGCVVLHFHARDCSPDTCVCIRLRALPTLLLGWLGG